MLTLAALFLLVLGTAQAQMNKTCCPPQYSALSYCGLMDTLFDYYYDSVTGDNLSVDTKGNLVMFQQAHTGRLYTRHLSNNTCTYQEFPELVGFHNCIDSTMTFLGAIKLDGKTFYEWHAHTSTLDSTIIVDDMCVPKILHRRLNDSPLLSAVYFNSIQFDSARQCKRSGTL
ncbi:hypothetical protein RRG08_058057 [Elysia crispata]|uniref:Uncharacterized protein n=1 Tax=Elysia crispata TaxID=231223 RepID=A0AAE1ABD6_9GAST|nr:hypothetical protein RRG08_058057 [Elysia crispata]